MAKINIIKKSKELVEEIDDLSAGYKALTQKSKALIEELNKKKALIQQKRALDAEKASETAAQPAVKKEEAPSVKAEEAGAAVVIDTAKITGEIEAIHLDPNEIIHKNDSKSSGKNNNRTGDNKSDNRYEKKDNRQSDSRRGEGQREPFNKDGKDNKFQKDDRRQQNKGYDNPRGGMSKDKDDDEDNFRRSAPRQNNKDKQSSRDMETISAITPSKARDTKNFSQKIRDNSKKTREDFWDDGKPTTNKAQHNSKQNSNNNKRTQAFTAPERKKAFVLDGTVTVKDFSETLGISVSEIVKKLMSYGIFATLNQEIDFDTASLVAEEFGLTVTRSNVKSAEEAFDDLLKEEEADESKMVKRPPIVTVMGHVDHGKTSLLDAIRNSHVTDKEAGGITQHIGAYTVNHNGNKITFLDTPGHEAFTTMRSRGAKVTDVAVIVVAANDGVMPQTIEAINHARAAETPIIIAMNKMDLYGVNPDQVIKQLSEQNVLVTDWGGDVECVRVSAKTRDGIEDLLEMILLVAEMQELKANPDTRAKGTIIEARLDKSQGPVATILVQNGTLREGETVVAGMTLGNVRAMFDHNGKRIKKAGPSIPVEITGLSDVPQAGDLIFAIEDTKLSKTIVEERISKHRAEMLNATKTVSLDDLFNQIKEGEMKTLNLIIKADVQGSVEAVKQSLEKLSNEEVKVSCIHGAVGAITEADVSLAKASNAIIIGFNVRTIGNVDDIAKESGVDVRCYSIIYNAIDDVTAAMKGMLAPVYKEVVHGRAEVRMTFRVSGVGTVAGSFVIKGKVARHDKVRILREGIVIYEGEMESLKRFKDDAKEVAEGFECGIGIKNYNDIKEMDIIEAYALEEVERK